MVLEMANKYIEHNKLDEVTLNYASNISTLTKIEQRFESYALFLLESINIEVSEVLNKYCKTHSGYKFSLEDSSMYDEYTSTVTVKNKDTSIAEFSYGFDYDLKIKNNEDFVISKSGYNFITWLSFYNKIIGDHYQFEKYWDSELSVFCKKNKWGIHNHKDDKSKWVLISSLPVDNNFTFSLAEDTVIGNMNNLFRTKQKFNLFSTTIPEQKSLMKINMFMPK